jgi:hypothetical protein
MQENGNAICNCNDSIEPYFADDYTPIEITPEHFEDVSWTVAYSPVLGLSQTITSATTTTSKQV